MANAENLDRSLRKTLRFCVGLNQFLRVSTTINMPEIKHWRGSQGFCRADFNSLKNERVHGTVYATRQQAMADVFQYIEGFYNRRRRHSTLGYCSPVEFLQDWLSKQQAQQSQAA